MIVNFNPFIVTYESIDHPLFDFKTECILAARKAEKDANDAPILIMMSGGVDSQIIAESFFAAKVPFKVLIGKLQIEVATETLVLNQHDIQYAEDWCKNHNIEILYHSIDVFRDAKKLTEYSFYSFGFSPQYAWHMELMRYSNSIGYFFVAGLGDIDIRIRDDEYFCCDTQREWSIDNFCERHNLKGIIRFCKQDSRMTASFLKLNKVQELMNQKVNMLLDYKYEYFNEVFPIISRPKQTGFERIQEWDSILRTYMKKHHGHFDEVSFIPITYFV